MSTQAQPGTQRPDTTQLDNALDALQKRATGQVTTEFDRLMNAVLTNPTTTKVINSLGSKNMTPAIAKFMSEGIPVATVQLDRNGKIKERTTVPVDYTQDGLDLEHPGSWQFGKRGTDGEVKCVYMASGHRHVANLDAKTTNTEAMTALKILGFYSFNERDDEVKVEDFGMSGKDEWSGGVRSGKTVKTFTMEVKKSGDREKLEVRVGSTTKDAKIRREPDGSIYAYTGPEVDMCTRGASHTNRLDPAETAKLNPKAVVQGMANAINWVATQPIIFTEEAKSAGFPQELVKDLTQLQNAMRTV
ncbi:MAG: hypothetical protein KKD39_03575 [Candidatus Altiarchaeota archaeon]|nr:hypothetical protein [Candidatus Altiarchaeota archaeon]